MGVGGHPESPTSWKGDGRQKKLCPRLQHKRKGLGGEKGHWEIRLRCYGKGKRENGGIGIKGNRGVLQRLGEGPYREHTLTRGSAGFQLPEKRKKKINSPKREGAKQSLANNRFSLRKEQNRRFPPPAQVGQGQGPWRCLTLMGKHTETRK